MHICQKETDWEKEREGGKQMMQRETLQLSIALTVSLVICKPLSVIALWGQCSTHTPRWPPVKRLAQLSSSSDNYFSAFVCHYDEHTCVYYTYMYIICDPNATYSVIQIYIYVLYIRPLLWQHSFIHIQFFMLHCVGFAAALAIS